MKSMTISHSDDGRGPVARQSTGSNGSNRQVSLYASRIKSPTPPLTSPTGTHIDHDRPPQLPQIPPLPLSPRWDSLSNGSHLLQSPTSPKISSHSAWYEQPHPQPQQPLTQHGAPLPVRDLSRIISEAQHDPPMTPTKSSFADMRPHDHQPAIENFSRPRKPSIKQPAADPAKLRLAYVPPSDLVPEMASRSPSTPSWQRSRGPSVSSKSSYAYVQSPSFPPANDFPDSRTNLARNVITPPIPSSRPPFGNNRLDTSTNGAAPWMGEDELRSSFRSQLTSSTAPGTAVTERSSVLTKDSSVSSLYANVEAEADTDEPSLEDVMGMYEKGFCTDEDDDEEDVQGHQDHQDHHDHRDHNAYQDRQDSQVIPEDSREDEHEAGHEDGQGDDKSDIAPSLDRRPMTAMSEPPHQRPPFDDFDISIDPVPPLPAAQSALDAEIRQSKMLFSSLAFTSTVPALSGNRTLSFPHRRDSARTVESEPSVDSDSARNDTKPTISATVISPPSITHSRSPSPSPSPAPLPVAEPEEPGSRDRYGFKKESQFITKQQYDAWDKGYSQYLARRRRKWIAYLKDSALMTDRPIRFPSPNAKTKRFVRKGIPPDWRGAAWFYYAGGPAILAKHAGLYDKLLLRRAKQVDIEAIERDLHRTFPDNIKFKPSPSVADFLGTTTSSERASQSTMTGSASDGSAPGPVGLEGEPPIIASLRRVLLAFSVYNPRIGYCQSLNFIAGLLLLFVATEEQCFWLLNVITHIYLPGTHEMSLEGSKVDLGVLMMELRDTMPGVWDKIGGDLESEPVTRPMTSKSVRKSPRPPLLKRKDTQSVSTERLPPITLCMTAWFMSCYIGTLPIETTLRVWDVFFYEGSKTLFRVALAIFKLGESEIKAVADPMEMFGVVQSMPRRMIDANKLMDICFRRRNGFNHLSQDVIEERRRERRDKVRQELQRQRGKTVTGGNVADAEMDVQRKGTLFGKKKS